MILIYIILNYAFYTFQCCGNYKTVCTCVDATSAEEGSKCIA